MTDQPPPQPPPAGSPGSDIMAELEAEVRQRAATGRRVYGTTLQAFNGRDQLKDARDEAIDLAAYLTAEMHERDALRADIDKANEITLDVMRERDLERQRADAAYDRAIRLEAERDALRADLDGFKARNLEAELNAVRFENGQLFKENGELRAKLAEAEEMLNARGDRLEAALKRAAEAERQLDLAHNDIANILSDLQDGSGGGTETEAGSELLGWTYSLRGQLATARALLEEAPSPDYPEEWPRWYAKRHAFLAPTPPAEISERVAQEPGETASASECTSPAPSERRLSKPDGCGGNGSAPLLSTAPAEPKPLSKTQQRTLALQRGEPLPAEAQPAPEDKPQVERARAALSHSMRRLDALLGSDDEAQPAPKCWVCGGSASYFGNREADAWWCKACFRKADGTAPKKEGEE